MTTTQFTHPVPPAPPASIDATTSAGPSFPPAPVTPAPAASTLPYHRTALAGPGHRWWRPLVTVAATVVAYVLMMVGTALVAVVSGLVPVTTTVVEDFDLNTWNGALLAFGLVALMLPAAAVGVRIAEGRGLGTLSSVAGRLRWSLLGPGLALAGILYAIVIGFQTLEAINNGAAIAAVTASTLPLVAVALLIVPIQSAAEEYMFRALPQQVLGSWLKSPWWGILLPIPVFVIGHGYDALGQVSVGLFALVAGILVWRTGGLELAIALHVVNNAAGMLLVAFGLADGNATTTDPASFITSTGLMVVFGVIGLTYHREQQAKLAAE